MAERVWVVAYGRDGVPMLELGIVRRSRSCPLSGGDPAGSQTTSAPPSIHAATPNSS